MPSKKNRPTPTQWCLAILAEDPETTFDVAASRYRREQGGDLSRVSWGRATSKATRKESVAPSTKPGAAATRVARETVGVRMDAAPVSGNGSPEDVDLPLGARHPLPSPAPAPIATAHDLAEVLTALTPFLGGGFVVLIPVSGLHPPNRPDTVLRTSKGAAGDIPTDTAPRWVSERAQTSPMGGAT